MNLFNINTKLILTKLKTIFELSIFYILLIKCNIDQFHNNNYKKKIVKLNKANYKAKSANYSNTYEI